VEKKEKAIAQLGTIAGVPKAAPAQGECDRVPEVVHEPCHAGENRRGWLDPRHA
jgi:hypothetical protein